MAAPMASKFSIAHVTPYPWEAQDNEVNVHVRRVCEELSARGHRVLVVAPSRSQERVRESRRALRAARGGAGGAASLLEGTDRGSPRVLAVGEVLDFWRPATPGHASDTRRRTAALPIDVARTVEEVLTMVPLDFVHVHEPFAPSTSNAALRHSRALNVGSFHSSSERLLSTLVARRFVESFLGRLDARTASLPATAELMAHHFPGDYRLVPDAQGAAAQLEEIYAGLARRRHSLDGDREIERVLAQRPLIEVDLHMHTDHSHDCATPVEVLLGDRARTGAGSDRRDRPQRDLGCAGARAQASDFGVKVIVGEEVKTAGQGEVIGLFIEEKIPRGTEPGRDRRRDQAPGRPGLRAAPVRPHALGARLRAPADDPRRGRRDRGLQSTRCDRGVQRGGRALRRQVSAAGRRGL